MYDEDLLSMDRADALWELEWEHLHGNKEEEDEEEEKDHKCFSYCMEDLGLSWSDF